MFANREALKSTFQRRVKREMNKLRVDNAQTRDEQIPAIVVKCVSAIEKQGKSVKGIYRISGVKSSVEKLCQSFENEADFVDLCNVPPNVIANVLKLYLRQLPEPLLTFHLYTDFIRVAKKYPTSRYSENISVKDEKQIIDDLKEVVNKLPRINYKTLEYLMHHLNRVSTSAAHNMPPSNLGIVFGPNLLRTNEDNCALRSLVDTVYQTRVVELLITYANEVFKEESIEDVKNGVSNGENSDDFDTSNERPKHVYATQSVITLAGQKVVTSSSTTTPTKQSLYELRRQFFTTPCSPPQFRFIPNFSPPNISPVITSNGSTNNSLTNTFQANNGKTPQLNSSSQFTAASNSVAQELRPTVCGSPAVSATNDQNETRSNRPSTFKS